ncbi:MAG: hypothetical protein ACRDBP_18595, partial [Luteolibacter sp.]
MITKSLSWLGHPVPTLLFFLFALPLHAADEVDPTIKLREQLRSVMLQLRTAQTDAANAQAEKAIADQKAEDQAAKITELDKRYATLV